MSRACWARCPLCEEMFDASTVVLPPGVRVVPAEAAILPGPLCSDCTAILGLAAIGLGTEVVLAVGGLPPVGDLLPVAADDPHTAWHVRLDVPFGSCALCAARGGAR